MRFDRMFKDLEGRMAHLEAAEVRAVSTDLTRAERAQVALLDRLRAAEGRELTVHLRGDVRVEGPVAELGQDWLLLGRHADVGRRDLMPLSAIVGVERLPARSRGARSSRLASPGIGSPLRRFAQDRALVRLVVEGREIRGRLASVGADHVDLEMTPSGESGVVRGARMITVPLWSLIVVRSH